MRTRYVPTISGLLLAVLLLSTGVRAADDDHWPHRVLITNDDGIDAAGIAALARAFAPIADTYVVAPEHNQSGTSNYCLLYTSTSPRDRTRSRMPSSA